MQRKLLHNGFVYADGVFERASLVVNGTRIEARVPAHADGDLDGVERIDLGGAWVIPGFVDTHFHLTTLALEGLRCDLSQTASREELYTTLGEWARGSDAAIVVGVGWDESRWPTAERPTRAGLDAIDDERPLLARRLCGHVGVVNTPFLRLLTKNAELIDEETGIVREHALWEAGRLGDPGPAAVAAHMATAVARLHAMGITAIHDIVQPGKIEGYFEGLRLAQRLRIDMLVHTTPGEVPGLCERYGDQDPEYVRLAGVKCFLDGSLGGRTAALNEPYADGEGRGTLLMETDALRRFARAAFDEGLVCAMHAIGDRAIDQALDVLGEFPREARCFRIEHCELVGPAQLERLRTTPVYLGVQPNFIYRWGAPGGLYERRLGPERRDLCKRFATLRDAGVPFVFGSDGMPPGPLYGLRGAIEHPVARERLRPADALDCYTRIPNDIGLQHREAGRLVPGLLADLTVLDGNPLEADLDSISVNETWVGGERVYTARDHL